MIMITKRLEFDAGHRIPNHKSQCRNLHGHRYALEISLVGEPIHAPGTSDHGMLMDFSDVKALAQEHLIEKWDHAFLVYKNDTPIVEFLATMPDHKTVILGRVPTVENLAKIAFDILKPVYFNRFGNGLALQKIVLFETPNGWAEVVG